MNAPSGPALVEPGHFHRLGIATDDHADVAGWLTSVLGARRLPTTMRQVHDLPMGGDSPTGELDDSGARTEIVWIADTPICLMIATRPDGQLGRYVERNGTGLHSVAWTVTDLWTADAKLRRHGARISGVDIAGRHFFIHPRDSAGLLIELTDTEFHVDPRDDPQRYASTPADPAALIAGAGVAWMTFAVSDITGAASVLSDLLAAHPVAGLPTEDCECCESLDLAIGDAIIRIVRAAEPTSRFAGLASGQGLHSFCIAVPDLVTAEKALTGHGISVVERDERFLWTDPNDTCGLRLQWVQRAP